METISSALRFTGLFQRASLRCALACGAGKLIGKAFSARLRKPRSRGIADIARDRKSKNGDVGLSGNIGQRPAEDDLVEGLSLV